MREFDVCRTVDCRRLPLHIAATAAAPLQRQNPFAPFLGVGVNLFVITRPRIAANCRCTLPQQRQCHCNGKISLPAKLACKPICRLSQATLSAWHPPQIDSTSGLCSSHVPPPSSHILYAKHVTDADDDELKSTSAYKPAGLRIQTNELWLMQLLNKNLEEVLSGPLIALLRHKALSALSEEERNDRVFGVGSALLQMLAVQRELGEPLNLNGDMLDDLLIRRVIRCRNDGHIALNEMFAATQLPNVKTGEMTRELLAFNSAHAIYDAGFRPPIYSRDEFCEASPTQPIPVVLGKRKAGAEAEVDSGKEPKQQKPSKRAKNDDHQAPQSNENGSKRRFRTRARR
ncbi:hypothetical protein C8R45DRAFT_948131 [Mycena sanguinolenta]|nr:hypothetical protein C8R45DRAFT_948131 [Mycena sanguinolenta]